MDLKLRPGKREDADVLAKLVNYAGEGLPRYLWEQLAMSGQSAWDVGLERARRDDGSFSYRNATVAEVNWRPAGCLIGYEISSAPEPIPDDMPAMFVPLQQLENLAPDTWYVNVLAVMPEYRNQGLGSALLDFADTCGKQSLRSGMSVIVSDANPSARRLYERHGYVEKARRQMIKEGWQNDGSSWVLLAKTFGGNSTI